VTVRYTYFVRRSDSIPTDLADETYRSTVFPAEQAIPGVLQIESARALAVDQPADVRRSLNEVVRMTSIWFDDEAAWQAGHVPLLEATTGRLGPTEGILTADGPQYDLLRDTPPQHYPYATMPLDWRLGRAPEVDEPDGQDLWRYVYFFSYPGDLSFAAGEDWYLGHHTREGKQLPGLVRYTTSKRLGPPRPDHGDPARSAREFVRFTELCFESFDTWYRVCYPEGLVWTMPAERTTSVWGRYESFFVGRSDLTFFAPTLPRPFVG
jgi:hypothetical protein